MRIGRERLTARLEADYASLMGAVAAMPEGALLEPGAVGQWSVRDLLAHIATWEREFLKALPIILEGRRLPHYSTLYGGIDKFNAMEQEAARGLSLAEVRSQLAESHAEVLRVVSELPAQEARTEQRLRRRLRQDTSGHYREHLGQVEAWQRG